MINRSYRYLMIFLIASTFVIISNAAATTDYSEMTDEELLDRINKIISEAEINLDNLLVKVLKQIHYYLNEGGIWRADLEKMLYKKGEIIEVLEGQAGSSKKI